MAIREFARTGKVTPRNVGIGATAGAVGGYYPQEYIMISPIGLAAGGIGGGLGLMALLNKEKGESLSSYPEPSRLEQVVGKEPNKNELSNAKMDEQWFKEHINIWRKVTEMEGLWDRGTINWKEDEK